MKIENKVNEYSNSQYNEYRKWADGVDQSKQMKIGYPTAPADSGTSDGGFSLDIDGVRSSMSSMYSSYSDMLSLVKTYQATVDKMANAWISPNGKACLEETVENLNSMVSTTNQKIETLFNSINAACDALAKVEGDSFQNYEFSVIPNKFDDANKKERLSGKIYIYVGRLNEVCQEYGKFQTSYLGYLDELLQTASRIPLSTQGQKVESAIGDASTTISKAVNETIDTVVTKINTKVKEQDWDVKMAIDNAEKELQKANA